MVAAVREVLVVVASPGDCDAERRRVWKVAQDLNNTFGPHTELRLRVEGWEQLPPDLGGPQDQINPLIDRCDVFIGLLAHRWGTPTGEYDSGFHEEFERVRTRRGDGARPRVSLYFKAIAEDRLSDPGPQLQLVLDFQARVQNEHLALYQTFTDADDLERRLLHLFTDVVLDLARTPPTSASEGSSADTAVEASESAVDELARDTIDDARQQIAQTTDGVTRLVREGPSGDNDIDTDRLLLVALALNRDGGYLPPHVANRLYLRRAELAVTVMEHDLWLDTLLADIGRSGTPHTRVIPGFALVDLATDLLAATANEDHMIATGAFRVLEQINWRPAELWELAGTGSEEVVQRWVNALRHGTVAEAAVRYAAAVAVDSDIALLDAILAEHEHEWLAALRALLADDPSPAGRLLATKYNPPGWAIDAVSTRVHELDDETLNALAASARVDEALTVAAFDELVTRSALDDDTLGAFLRRDDSFDHPDSAIDIVMVAAQRPGSSVTAERLATVSDRLKETSSIDLAPAILALTNTVDGLLILAAHGDYHAWEALVWKPEPRLVDRARAMFDTDAAELIQPLQDDEAWTRARVLPFLRWRMRTAALRIIVGCGTVTDDDRQRLKAEITTPKRYGNEAERLFLQAAAADDLDFLLTLLEGAQGRFRDDLVATILRVAGSAGARAVLAAAPDKPGATAAVHALGADAKVTDDELRELLHARPDDVRIAALAELGKRMHRPALEHLLDTYPDERETYYYNVVAELDRMLYLTQGHDTQTPGRKASSQS